MGIRSLALDTSTSPGTLTLAGAVTKHFAEDSMIVPNGVHLICTDDGVLERRQITFKSRPSVYDPKTNTYTKSKGSFSIAKPVTLTSGAISFATVRIELEAHPETGEDDRSELINLAIGALLAEDTQGFWNYGAKS